MAKIAAVDAFIARKSEIDALLARIQAASDAHIGASPDDVDWGHVGTMAQAAEMLANVAGFLNA